MADAAASKISFFQKNDTTCPICEKTFKKEDLRVGGGRQIAGPLGDDLRRYYEASKKFGEVFPMIYAVMTCPHCFYSTLVADFLNPDPKALDKLKMETNDRKAFLKPLFPNMDFQQPKTLLHGAAGYALALHTYQSFTNHFSPSIKSGICALRAAWCCNDLHAKYPTENYDYLSKIFFNKARFYYSLTVEREQNGQETVNASMNFGPDVDNNFGFDGVMYLTGFLEYNYGDHSNIEQRNQSLTMARRAIARLVGMGKSSKSKPSALLEKAKDLHKLLGDALKPEGSSPAVDNDDENEPEEE